MSALGNLRTLSLDGAKISVSDGKMVFSGTLSMRNPHEIVSPFLRGAHEAATRDGLEALTVDLTELTFAGSSAIRSILEWVDCVQHEPEDRRYVLSFVTNPDVLWHKTTLSAIRHLYQKVIAVS